jgi:hypothetical protein
MSYELVFTPKALEGIEKLKKIREYSFNQEIKNAPFGIIRTSFRWDRTTRTIET